MMNDRIKELLEQSGFQYIEDEGIGWAGNHNASLPKFAELIVKECAGICDERARSAPMGSDEQCEAEDCSYSIKKYFEVE